MDLGWLCGGVGSGELFYLVDDELGVEVGFFDVGDCDLCG